MYSIMIVDDEPAIRKGLVRFMPWNFWNCKVVAVASDGIEAMDALKQEQPDIIITDIKMPGMNGLELSKYIHENYPIIKIIILTAFSDFEYSQSALKYGVVDFILKPTSIDKFYEAIKNAIAIIDQERGNRRIIENLRCELSYQSKEIQETQLLKIMHGIEIDPIFIEKKSKTLDITLDSFIAVVAQVNLHSSKETLCISENAIISAKKLLNSFFKNFTHYTVIIDPHHICIFLNISKENACQSLQNIFDSCQELVYIGKNLNNLDILFGISGCHNTMSAISKAYNEALSALSNNFYENNDVYLYTKDTSNCPSLQPDQLEYYITQIAKLVQACKYEDTLDVLEKIFIIHRDTNQTIETTKNTSMLLYSMIIGFLPKQWVNTSYINHQTENIGAAIWQSKSLDDIYRILSSVIQSIILDAHNTDMYTPSIIDKIDEYILNHYHENISLTSIANHVHLNSSYLSRLYKKETNLNLTEKITNIRMEKAKILLKTTNLKVYELASLVGIDNPAYFSILFNKYTGYYPKEYRFLRDQ